MSTPKTFNIAPPMVKILWLLGVVLLLAKNVNGRTRHHKFVVKSSPYTRLCSTKEILTVNGKFPGPTLRARRGDKLIVRVYNRAKYNITLHWHGVKQPRNPWSDGPEYVTQCPIQPGKKFTYKIQLSSEEGTVWWHAHSGWARATVHGAFIIYPKRGQHYPFPKPHAEIPIILGEWWKQNVMEIPGNANVTGGEPILSNALTINGEPGYLYPCSKQGTFKLMVKQGRRYLLRIINAVLEEDLFFAVANHRLTIVGKDGCYLKPFKTDYIMIATGQSMDVLLEADQPPSQYAMSARAYASAFGAGFDNTSTASIVEYHGKYHRPTSPHSPPLPPYNATKAAADFTKHYRTLATKHHPANVPLQVDTHLFFTLSVNLINCTRDKPCTGPLGKRFSASVNNVSFVTPSFDLLQAYYYGIKGVYEEDFPRKPPYEFNYTGERLPFNLLTPTFGTKVMVLDYNASVEIILQGTNVLASDHHPIHIHGYSFYVVGWGFGKFDPKKDPLRYNLVNPPEETTVGVPNNGWVAIRFRADNPGVWLMHCHLERHQTWGMGMVFLVKNGDSPGSRILRPPRHLPKC
ncbi:Laccase-14 [Turnera subulata]|uniref:Laccase n=1 Tax=Turnera subulata TaxID=218843 RepID=A0A9Q0J1F5_9ROSI|nr:Laccase-14 [Turnera subulata]